MTPAASPPAPSSTPAPPGAAPFAALAPFGALAPRGPLRLVLGATRAMPGTWAGRRAAFALRALAVALMRRRPVDAEALGARLRLLPFNNVCERRILFTPQFFDPEELAHLDARLPPDPVFLDVGANIGGYALFVAGRSGPGSRVLAVEPQPDVFARLVANIRLNGFATVKALDCAVADRDGEATLFLDAGNRGESGLKVVTGRGGELRVPAKSLLTLLREERLSRVDAAKFDTEGAEDLILEAFFRDAEPALHPGLIVIERSNERWHLDVPALLAANGYRLSLTTKNNLIFERGPSDAPAA